MIDGGDFDETEFVLSNGVQCKTKINACFTHKKGTEMHGAITQRIWGWSRATAAQIPPLASPSTVTLRLQRPIPSPG